MYFSWNPGLTDIRQATCSVVAKTTQGGQNFSYWQPEFVYKSLRASIKGETEGNKSIANPRCSGQGPNTAPGAPGIYKKFP
jgi:hypothetical protein